ncbi:class I tRNA ligase family protein [Lentilitoribacter sp. EG35]|uniref:class I tRNA ligase family protein n=1 Tax=Lentilitoribacter sp. EG35 TaxID=3234192 RepID=UPI00346045D3
MKSYITTPIYYVNGAPHIGHAHTSTMADILKRNRKALGYDTKLTTGCDEHGQKNQEAALESGMPITEYLTMRSGEFQRLFDMINVDYDYFVHTSRPEHMRQVANVEQRMFDAGLIIKKQYSGLYCTGCEQFKKTTDLTDEGNCPDHPNLGVEELDELNYFLNIEPYRQQLLEHIEENPKFVDPPIYRAELKRMLAEPLEDLCISRPKTRVSLGVELPFDNNYVTYVWFDALFNYLTNLDWPKEGYEQWWQAAEHTIGKDILKTHGVYWPIMLMSIGESPPARLSVHGHWVGPGGIKMSKSLGNVVDPIEVIEVVGTDALRYFLARNMRSDGDSNISLELVRQTYNSELGNKLGNLLSRAAKFSKKQFDDRVPTPGLFGSADEIIRISVLEAVNGFARRIEMADIPRLTQQLITVCDRMNNYFAEQAPWDLIKDPITDERCRTVIYVSLDCIRLVFEALRQVIPMSSNAALLMLNCLPNENEIWQPALDSLPPETKLNEIETLYPRITE